MAFFRRSPEAQCDGPVETMIIDGRTFALVAIPGNPEPEYDLVADGLVVLHVQKHHSVMFAKGRTIEIMSFGDGNDYVPQITEASGLFGLSTSAERVLPAGWSVREVTLQQDLVVEVPYPARVCFFSSGHSFQGPVNLDC